MSYMNDYKLISIDTNGIHLNSSFIKFQLDIPRRKMCLFFVSTIHLNHPPVLRLYRWQPAKHAAVAIRHICFLF